MSPTPIGERALRAHHKAKRAGRGGFRRGLQFVGVGSGLFWLILGVGGRRKGGELAVVGVLTEVPFMLFLVWLCKKTKEFRFQLTWLEH